VQAAKAYDIALVCLQGSDAKINFSFRESWPEDALVLPRCVVGHREMWEVHERLDAERATEDYMEELCRQSPERVKEERLAFERYKTSKIDEARPSGAPVIDLTGEDIDTSIERASTKIFRFRVI
jgi:hypothetical protein